MVTALARVDGRPIGIVATTLNTWVVLLIATAAQSGAFYAALRRV